MNEALALPGTTPIAIDSGNVRLHGVLTLPARFSALVVLPQAGPLAEGSDAAIVAALHDAAFGTLAIDLLSASEQHFADNRHNVPLLARRLLDALALCKRWTLLGELPPLPIGLCAADDCSPVVVRVAALRDHDVFAVVCLGGLIDLAGILYLHSLASPLLVLVAADDERIAASNRRALRELSCARELQLLPAPPASDPAVASPAACVEVSRETARWFARHLPAVSTPAVGEPY